MVQCLALCVGHRSFDSIVFPNKHSLVVSYVCSYSMPMVSIVRDTCPVACKCVLKKIELKKRIRNYENKNLNNS